MNKPSDEQLNGGVDADSVSKRLFGKSQRARGMAQGLTKPADCRHSPPCRNAVGAHQAAEPGDERMKAITRMKHTMRAQLTNIIALQSQLARTEADLRTAGAQRAEACENQRHYRQALDTVVQSLGMLADGAVSQLTKADRAAYGKMSNCSVNHVADESPDRK